MKVKEGTKSKKERKSFETVSNAANYYNDTITRNVHHSIMPSSFKSKAETMMLYMRSHGSMPLCATFNNSRA